ncbi:MAG: DNA-binding protein Alba [Candidatus Aenigmatarchaeota archaeon]|nr:MAG: DNA-binding protein Alba [Candidatus Aenigmarchaeota archaeon]
MSEEQKALNDVLTKKPKEKAEETKEPAPEEQSEEQQPAEEKPEQEEEVKPEPAESEPEQKDEAEQTEPAPEEKKEEAEPAESATDQPEKSQPEEGAAEEKPAEEPKEEVPEKPEEPKKKETQAPKQKLAENVVLVGKKPTMSYVLAAVTQFSDGIPEIHIKARGRSISRAVDVAEVVKNRFVQDLKTDVQIGTQEVTDENNNKINVSTIDIVLKK